ncbi:hypothetical protein [Adonisia turfae]|uniref:Uncharacterized protein n=1 Tax=Adonisia turfae CCMR0081 TaxID=2292702 RepID=A0A6M0RYI4_9CYAN|nr:hypothetical protein [Adonisia turfae]NEZ60980.1 hypothetical protein [Adonisia turfae CCMR0081]
MVSHLDDKKSWIGSLVISEQSASKIGYVKAINPMLEDAAETIIVVPSPIVWLPMEITGASQFASDSIIGGGDGCLIVQLSSGMTTIPQSDFGRIVSKGATISWKIPLKVFQILLVSLVSLPAGMLFLARLLGAKPLQQQLVDLSSSHGDDDDNSGLSPMRQPRSPGPLPTHDEALALPLVDTQKDTETYPMTQLIVQEIPEL